MHVCLVVQAQQGAQAVQQVSQQEHDLQAAEYRRQYESFMASRQPPALEQPPAGGPHPGRTPPAAKVSAADPHFTS